MAVAHAASGPVARGTAAAGERAVFVDKDGTLITDVPYNVDPLFVSLTFGAGTALARLSAAGFRPIVVSNQPGIAYGRFGPHALLAVEERIQELLAPYGVAIEAFYYCPHAGSERCGCRKPAPGLIDAAASDRGIDLTRSWLVGDILDDVEAGRRAGCRTALIANGNETEWCLSELRTPTIVADSLPQAARAILAAQRTYAERHGRPRDAGALVGSR
jgi:D-glycero-D-manno-heptose 1,7-bisphosphate phosphatase